MPNYCPVCGTPTDDGLCQECHGVSWQRPHAKGIVRLRNEDCGLFHEGQTVTLLYPTLGDVSRKPCWMCTDGFQKWKVLATCLEPNVEEVQHE